MADSDPWQQAALRIVATSMGAAIAGPIGAAIGPFLGVHISNSAIGLIGAFGNDATKEAATRAADFCYGQFVQAVPGPGLEAAFREALREALGEVHSGLDAITISANPEWKKWFSLWEQRLKEPTSADAVADLQQIPQLPDKQQAYLENLFQSTMERLAAEQRAWNANSLSLNGHHRSLDPELLAILRECLPQPLQARYHFHVDRNLVAAAEASRIVQQLHTSLLSSIGQRTVQIAQDTAQIPDILAMLKQIQSAQEEGRLSVNEASEQRARADELAAQLRKLKESVAIRAVSEPAEVPFADLVANNDLDAAEKLKHEEIQSGRAKLALDYFDLGRVRELRFDWVSALDAYKQAWNLERSFDFGFQYAYACDKQNRHPLAIQVYEDIFRDAPSIELRAITLNNLATLYSTTERMKEAERTYVEALKNYRELASFSPNDYSAHVADTLNNLGELYRVTQRMKKAEDCHREALKNYNVLRDANPESYLAHVATTQTNLGNVFRDIKRMGDAHAVFKEALELRRLLVTGNADAYLPDLADSLNNLATVYHDTQRIKEAEAAYEEALAVRRTLAGRNPEAHLPNVAMTLYNMAALYHDTLRMEGAKAAYEEALVIRRELATTNPAAHLPNVAMTLNNLAVLYCDAQRMHDAEKAYEEALKIRREFAKANPNTHLPEAARILNNLAKLYWETQRIEESASVCREATDILEPFWKEQPELHGDQMGRTWFMLSFLLSSESEALDFLLRALAAAYDPALKQTIQDRINTIPQ